MGTFIFRATSLLSRSASIGDWQVGGSFPASDAQLVNASAAVGGFVWNALALPNTGSASLRFQGSWFLDIDPFTPKSLNQLPSGFNVTALNFHIAGNNWAVFGVDNDWFLVGAGEIALPVPKVSNPPANPFIQLLDITPVPSLLVIDGAFGIDQSRFGTVNGFPSITQFYLEGEYDLFGFQYTIDPIVDIEKNRGPASAQPNGTPIIITSDPDDPTALQLDHITLTLPCGIPEITVQTENLIIFFIPSGPCEGDVPVTGTGDGTQFSGSVELATLTILVTNGSGVYKLTDGATHDELYSSVRDGSTYDVKIPNPFGKTGFIK